MPRRASASSRSTPAVSFDYLLSCVIYLGFVRVCVNFNLGLKLNLNELEFARVTWSLSLSARAGDQFGTRGPGYSLTRQFVFFVHLRLKFLCVQSVAGVTVSELLAGCGRQSVCR